MVIYGSSVKSVLSLFFALVLIPGLLFGHLLKGNFPVVSDNKVLLYINGFEFGATVGAMFGVFVLFYGLGQKVLITEDEFIFSRNLLSLFVKRFRERIKISQIEEVILGLPKKHYRATFAAINIRSTDQEIAFNPDLFDRKTLQKMFADLNYRNSNIRFDQYGQALIRGESGEKVLALTVLKYSLLTVVFMISIPLLAILIHKMAGGIISKKVVYYFVLGFLFFLPFILNKIMVLLEKD